MRKYAHSFFTCELLLLENKELEVILWLRYVHYSNVKKLYDKETDFSIFSYV